MLFFLLRGGVLSSRVPTPLVGSKQGGRKNMFFKIQNKKSEAVEPWGCVGQNVGGSFRIELGGLLAPNLPSTLPPRLQISLALNYIARESARDRKRANVH